MSQPSSLHAGLRHRCKLVPCIGLPHHYWQAGDSTHVRCSVSSQTMLSTFQTETATFWADIGPYKADLRRSYRRPNMVPMGTEIYVALIWSRPSTLPSSMSTLPFLGTPGHPFIESSDQDECEAAGMEIDVMGFLELL